MGKKRTKKRQIVTDISESGGLKLEACTHTHTHRAMLSATAQGRLGTHARAHTHTYTHEHTRTFWLNTRGDLRWPDVGL